MQRKNKELTSQIVKHRLNNCCFSNKTLAFFEEFCLVFACSVRFFYQKRTIRINGALSRVMKMDKSQNAFFLLIFVFVLLLITTEPLTASITNGYFSNDQPGTGWTFGLNNIDVTSDSTAYDYNGIAVLRPDDESEPSTSYIYQDNIFLLPTETMLSFDITMFKSDLGGDTDEFTATFGAHQYTLSSSDITGTFYEETVTFDLTGWAPGPYTLSFQLANDPDEIFTAVGVDNVNLIPAPGALILAVIGASFVSLFRKSKHI